MKFIGFIVLIIGLGYLLHLFLPWWIIVVLAAVIGAATSYSGIRAFVMGFLGVAILWGLTAILINTQNEGILTGRMGALFGNTSAGVLIIFTALLGGFLGGLGAMTGAFGRKIIKAK